MTLCFSFQAGNLAKDDYDRHIIKKDEAREAKRVAKEKCNTSTCVIAVDLQSVLLCPRLQASAVYYHTKLQLHNFSIFRLNDADVTLYVWNETNGGVTANEFASCVVDYINGLPAEIKEVIIISDGCSYQNRNRVLSSALSDTAKSKQIRIEQLILEKGHTMMEADSIHATLEQVWKKQNIFAPTDYLCFMRQARPQHPYLVKTLDYTFFQNFADLSTNFKSIRPGKCSGAATVTDIRGLCYEPSGSVHYRVCHTDEWDELPCRRPAAKNLIQPQQLYSELLKITATKFKHLQQLKPLMPVDYHLFYDNLPHE